MSITLNTAVRALLAQQLGVDTTSHNISNATTAGYSRQRVRFEAIPGVYTPDGLPHPGYGVDVIDINRVRDLFVDYQLRQQFTLAAGYDAQTQALQRIETVLGEPGGAGLRAALDGFFNAWRDLSNNPESGPARIAVTQAGQTLALTANRLATTLQQARTDADERVRGTVTEVNALTEEIAALNDQIMRMQLGGTSAADLRDRRDLAIDRLSQLVNITYLESADGRVQISTGGHALVANSDAFAIEGVPDPLNSNYVDLRFVADGFPLTVSGGEVRALLDMRDTYLPNRLTELNTLLGQVITDINAIHAAGFGLDGVTGRAFFTGTGASTIAVDAAILASPNAIAASATAGGVPGDGSIALALADQQYLKTLGAGTQTYDEFYGSYVSGIGVTLSQSRSRGDAQNLVLEQLRLQRESVAGVNLDEEMVSLVRYQRAYEAASRLVRVADELLDTIINRML